MPLKTAWQNPPTSWRLLLLWVIMQLAKKTASQECWQAREALVLKINPGALLKIRGADRHAIWPDAAGAARMVGAPTLELGDGAVRIARVAGTPTEYGHDFRHWGNGPQDVPHALRGHVDEAGPSGSAMLVGVPNYVAMDQDHTRGGTTLSTFLATE